tara:strand:- start:887 stop:994 length:108 start_codon:yes stop_codon:yes gene_type:complete
MLFRRDKIPNRKYGDSGGDILDTHPALSYRVQKLK